MLRGSFALRVRNITGVQFVGIFRYPLRWILYLFLFLIFLLFFFSGWQKKPNRLDTMYFDEGQVELKRWIPQSVVNSVPKIQRTSQECLVASPDLVWLCVCEGTWGSPGGSFLAPGWDPPSRLPGELRARDPLGSGGTSLTCRWERHTWTCLQ